MITTFEIDVNGINSYEKLNEKVVKNRIKYKKMKFGLLASIS